MSGNFGLKINEEVLKQWDEEIEKNKPIYKFINNEEYSKNIEGFINEIVKRRNKEVNIIIKNAYDDRINKSNKLIEKLNNTN